MPPESETANFGVVKLHVDNWRWQGVAEWVQKAMNKQAPAETGHGTPPEPPIGGAPDKPSGAEADSLANPFPEGYGEDLLDDDL